MRSFPEAQAGHCDQVVEALLANSVEGVRRDGVWLGGAATWGGHWDWRRDDLGRPIHVWIERSDGSVVDPTRWVLEGVFPYTYEGLPDLYMALEVG